MENLNNLPPFFIGQKVVYITGRSLPKNFESRVLSIRNDGCKCSPWLIKIHKDSKESTYDIKKYDNVICATCGCLIPVNIYNQQSGYWYATSFRPLQEQKFPLISYSKVLEEVEVGSN